MDREIIVCRDVNQLTLYLTYRNRTRPVKVLVLDDIVVHQKGYIGASMFLPPLQALTFLVEDNDRLKFREIYMQYLHSAEIDEFVTLFVAAMYKGSDIVFYMGESDPAMFMDVFMEYLNSRGIHPTPFEIKTNNIVNPFELKNALYCPTPAINPLAYQQWRDRIKYYGFLNISDDSPFKKLEG